MQDQLPKDPRGTKRPRDDEDHYDTLADNEAIQLEVTTGEGLTLKFALPAQVTVLRVKEEVEQEHGVKPRDAMLFAHNVSCEEELEDSERLRVFRRAKGAKVEMSLLVEQADAQQVVPQLEVEPCVVLGDGCGGSADKQLHRPVGVAFVPAHPDWLVTSEGSSNMPNVGNRIKISNIHTGALVCKFGDQGGSVNDRGGEREFDFAIGVTVTSDSSFVLVTDHFNNRVKVLRLCTTNSADGDIFDLEFDHNIGSGLEGDAEGDLFYPTGVALLPGDGGQETVLVTETIGQRVSQFALDGTFIRVFAGTGREGSTNSEFDAPQGIAVLGSSGEVAVADLANHRVQIFDGEGNYQRSFGSEGEDHGQLTYPSEVASDAHGNLLVLDSTSRLQVFSPKGKHLCTRNDLFDSLGHSNYKGIAWSAGGDLAIAVGLEHKCYLWGA
jgi:DNA-binding beta-propeller fold protein YncE